MKKILIAIPTAKNIEVETFKSIFELAIPEGYTTFFQYFYGYSVDQVRNLIADYAIKNDFDYLFCVDSDMILPWDTLVRLLAIDKPIASGLYRQRFIDDVIIEAYVKNGDSVVNLPYGELESQPAVIELNSVGFGGVLIKKEVLLAMDYPHFLYQHSIDFKDTISEDTYFCIKAREKGFSTYALRDLRYQHIASVHLSI